MALQKASLHVHKTLPQMGNGLSLSLSLIVLTVAAFHRSERRF